MTARTAPATSPPVAGPLSRVGEFWVARALVGAAFLSALLAAVVIAIDQLSGSVTENVLMTFLINLLVVIGLQAFTGNSGVVSFGHVAFMAIGAYTTAILSTNPAIKETLIPDAPGFLLNAQLGFVQSTFIAIGVTCLIALPLGFVFARLGGAAAAIATLAWLVIVRTVIANWETVTAGTFTFYGIEPYTTVWWALAWAIVAITVARLFRESGLGMSLRATSSDELVARAVGVNMTMARLAAWVLSAGIAAVGGVLYAHYILALAPTSFYFELTFLTLVMLIVGGRSVSGAVIGAAIISVIAEFLRRGENATERFGLSTLILAAIFVLIIIVRPGGLLGRWELDELLMRASRRFRVKPTRPVAAERTASAGALGDTAQARPRTGQPTSVEEGSADHGS
jgi:branched-chain amino acid transport system permease protein